VECELEGPYSTVTIRDVDDRRQTIEDAKHGSDVQPHAVTIDEHIALPVVLL